MNMMKNKISLNYLDELYIMINEVIANINNN